VTYFDNQNRDFQSALDSLLKEFDQSVSVYQPNSIVSKVNRNEDIELDEWFIDNFNLSQQVSKETDGAFDLTIAPIANVWGFGTFQKPDSVNHHLIDSLKQIVDYRKVSVFNKRLIKEDSRIMLNFNAVAQGFAVDVMGEFLQSQGIENFLIDLGGEIYAKGSKPNGDPWKIGIEIPEDGAEERFYNRIVSLKDEAVATSGNYRKFYELDGVKYAHSLNPKTGYPVRHSLLSTTVIAPTAGEADAYATAFMVMGVDATLEFIKSKPNLKVYLMYDDAGEIKTAMSPNFEKYISAGSE
jgi:thiamine biosynthesis lipoprotein